MGKRTKEKTEEEIKRKIRRLEKELLCRRELSPGDDGDYDCEPPLRPPTNHYLEYDDESGSMCPQDVDTATDECLIPSSERPTILSEIHEPNLDQGTKSLVVETEPGVVEEEENTIPSEILAVLGVAKSSEECFGAKIPKEIAERWGKILIDGLQKEQKESLLAQTLIPENFQLSIAPKLNAEVVAVLNEPTKNRDKRLEKMQNQLGSGIAGIATLTSELISQQDLDKIDVIRKLSEINQILLDLHYEETMNRRRLIIPMLDKSFINIIQGVKREKYLFGDNLTDNIRTTKSIEKSSLQIKKSLPQQTLTSRRPATSALQGQGNSRAPPRQASRPGAARAPPAHTRYYQPPPPPPPPPARRPPPGPRRPPPPPPSRPQDRRNRR